MAIQTEPESIKENIVTLAMVKAHPAVSCYVNGADGFMEAIGYTEHGERHASLVAHIAHNILQHLGFTERETQLAAIAGYLHDIGNVISRNGHGVSGALLARPLLSELKMPEHEIATVMNAIGNHEEEYGWATSRVAAAVILADKSDVHRSRVRNDSTLTFDIHDRVNYAASKSFLRVNPEDARLSLEIEIDTEISQVMEYFEIFLSRMVMCRRAAEFLDCKFSLVINGITLL